MNWYVLDKKEYVDSYQQLGIVYREISEVTIRP